MTVKDPGEVCEALDKVMCYGQATSRWQRGVLNAFGNSEAQAQLKFELVADTLGDVSFSKEWFTL